MGERSRPVKAAARPYPMKDKVKRLTIASPADLVKLAEARIAELRERDVTPNPEQTTQERERRLRDMRSDYQRRLARGEIQPLQPDPVTGKRPTGTGRAPRSGWRSPILKPEAMPDSIGNAWRWRSRRERANELAERMAKFSAVYNAGYLVRDAYFGPDERRQRMVKAMIVAMYEALCSSDDCEAILFAVADALYASPTGVPWEP